MNTSALRPARLVVVLACALLAAALPVRATLLVYEGFNGYTTGALAPQDPNANTVGLDTSVGYYDGTMNRTAGYTVQSAGLSFGPLQTAGGALAFTSATNVIGADISLPSAYTGTLWSSYLVNLSGNSAANSSGAVLRIGTTPADTSAYFNNSADTRFSANTKVGAGYGTNISTDGTGTLALNTTYIVIASFTNVGVALSGTTTGVANLWALTLSQFQSFIAAGGDTSALNTYATITATSSPAITSGTFNFDSSHAFGIVTAGDTGTIDELRFGSTLADVTPIPEPAATALAAGLGCAALLLLRRRRRACRSGSSALR